MEQNLDTTKLKSNLVKMMLGCLIAAAAIAIATILIGKFGDTTANALGTVFLALVHISIIFGLVSLVGPKSDNLSKSANFVTNFSIGIVVLSFFTSIFLVWGALDGEIAAKLYVTYVVVLFAIQHGKSLSDVTILLPKVKNYVVANYIFIAVVALMILGLVYLSSGGDLIAGFYGRLLAASVIVDVTLSIIIAVMYRLHVQQHPELIQKQPARANSGVRIILLILLFLLVIVPLLQMLFSFLMFSTR